MNKDFNKKNMIFSGKEIDACLSFLEKLSENTELLANLSEPERIALLKSCGRLSRPDKLEIIKRKKDIKESKRKSVVTHDRKARSVTGIRTAREANVFVAPGQITANPQSNDNVRELKSPRNCYVCKKEFTRLHFFYDSMCPECADFNYQKRFQTASLKGRIALITGSRLKIGYQATLMMLRSGAKVIATTRFPVDSALRFSKEEDFSMWGENLHIYGLDLRHTPSVEIFANYIERKYERLDILINNAAQTVRRPPGFYAHLMSNEERDFHVLPEKAQSLLSNYKECKENLFLITSRTEKPSDLPVTWNASSPGMGIHSSAQLSQIPYTYDHNHSVEKIFPDGKLDADLQQVDLRDTNSWRLKLGDVHTTEMIEIQLVNAIAPFVLCNRLANMMKRDNTGQKHIVNVSAMEGKFLRFKNSGRHPHTNMAKAALNMLTNTSAEDLSKYGIFMNAVDTGWVTDEDPHHLSRFKQEVHDFQPPLDIVDGAARVCDPFFHGIISGKHWCGCFLKDYHPIDW